jgi:hypothetical protein
MRDKAREVIKKADLTDTDRLSLLHLIAKLPPVDSDEPYLLRGAEDVDIIGLLQLELKDGTGNAGKIIPIRAPSPTGAQMVLSSNLVNDYISILGNLQCNTD